MEEYFDITHDQEEAEDALSFCNLPIHDNGADDEFSDEYPYPSPDRDLFEFCFSNNPRGSQTNPTEHANTSGNLIPYEEGRRLTTRASSLRIPSSKPNPSPATGSFRYSSKTVAAAARSKKHVFMFGVPKFPPEMELGDMRKRQSKLAPAPMFPAVDGGEAVVTGEGGRRRSNNRNWGLLRLLKCWSRTHFGSALATSFGRLSVV